MVTPVLDESAPKEPVVHPGVGPVDDKVSEDSSSDSSSGSDSESGSSSDSPTVKKLKLTGVVENATEDSASDAESDNNSSSGSVSANQSSVSSELPGSFKTPKSALEPAALNHSPAPVKNLQVTGELNIDQIIEAAGQIKEGLAPLAPAPVQSPQVATPIKPVVVPTQSLPVVPVELPVAVSAPLIDNLFSIRPSIGAATLKAALAKQLPQPSSDAEVLEGNVEIDFAQIIPAPPAASSRDDPSTAERSKARRKAKKASRAMKASDDYKEERYKLEVLKLNRALDLAEQGKKKKSSSRKKGGKQPKGPAKRRKRKKTVRSSSDDSSSDSSTSSSSSASEAVAPNRIPKLPQGRQLQILAMTRVNEFGFVKDSDVKMREVTEALRVIDNLELDLSPQMAYRFFHQVPGSGLPHMQKHYVSFRERYSVLIKAVVKFHLLQIQKTLNDKKSAVVPDQNTPFSSWWQFQNDLARAPSASGQAIPPPLVAVAPPVVLPINPAQPTPRHRRSKKSKKSSSKAASKALSSSRKRQSSSKAGKKDRADSKGKSGKKKRKRADSSSDSNVVYSKESVKCIT